MTPLQVLPPRVALTDQRTGMISREWYLFLLRDFERGTETAGLVNGFDERIDLLEAADVLLDGRVDALETDVGALDVRVDALEAAPPGSGHVIEDEGVPLTQRATINFAGAGVTVTDTGTKTLVTIAGGGGSGGGNSYFPSGW